MLGINVQFTIYIMIIMIQVIQHFSSFTCMKHTNEENRSSVYMTSPRTYHDYSIVRCGSVFFIFFFIMAVDIIIVVFHHTISMIVHQSFKILAVMCS